MGIAGNLRTMQLSELLQWLSTGMKTGTLVVRGASCEKRIYFEKGRLTSSSSTLEREYLGRFLVGFGYITETELQRALEVQQESKILLGKILVMIGAIQEDELSELLRLKAAETIYDIFLWNEGSFAFLDGKLPTVSAIPISSDVTGIVMEGLRRYDEWQRIRTRIGSMREIPEVVVPVEQHLGDREQKVVQAMDGRTPIDEISVSTHNPDFFVAKLVYDLLESGNVRIVGERPEAPASRPEQPAPVADAGAEEMVFVETITPAVDPMTSGLFTKGVLVPEGPISPFRKPPPGRPQATPPPPPVLSGPPAAPAPQEFVLAPPEAEPQAPHNFSRFLRQGPDSGHKGRTPRVRSDTVPKFSAPPALPSETSEAPAGLASSVSPTAVPRLTKPMEELMSHSFTPNEAFIVSRINGLWDVRSITRISPFPDTEVLRVFQKLHDSGVISWK